MSHRLTFCLVLLTTAALSLGATSAPIVPATPFFERLTVNDGLPDNSVRAIIQDRLGFLWFGTQNGLVRYDGHTMRPYGPRNPATRGYTNLAAIALLEDRDGDLWIGTFATGLWRLRMTTGDFEQWGPDAPPERRLGGLYVTSICQDRDGTIWAALGEGGLAAVDPADGSVQQYRHHAEDEVSAAPPAASLTSVTVDDSGRLWAASEGAGLAYRDADSEFWHHLRHDPDDPRSLPADIVTHVHQDADGHIWITTREGLGLWNPETRDFTVHVPYPDNPTDLPNYLVQADHDHWGRLWIGSAVGLFLFHPETGEFQHFTHDPDRDHSPLRGPVLSILCDSAGIVWGGTWLAGLNKIDPAASRFETASHDPEDPGSLDNESVQAVFEDSRGILWVGTGDLSGGLSLGGLNSRLPGSPEFRHHPFPADDQLQPTGVFALCEDPVGTLWIGTNRGLWQLPPGHHQPRRTSQGAAAGAPLHDISVHGLSIGPDGELWIGTYGRGLLVLNRDTGKVRQYITDPDDPTSLPQMNPVHLYRDRHDRMWIGLDTRGLALYEPATDSFRPSFDPAQGLASPVVLTEDRHGNFWVGAVAGLLQLDTEGRVIRTVTVYDGLPNNMVSAVLDDDQGRLWLSTGRGFARFDPESGEIKTYDQRDGLPTNEAHTAQWRGRDGTLYFGGRKGLVSFDPAAIGDAGFVPPVVITELRVADTPLQPGADSPLVVPVEVTDEVVLPHHQNDLTFSFAALHFARPERNRYRFHLSGADDHWRDSVGQNRAFYTNLAPGKYRFEVRGSNADGLWNPESTVLTVHILPPWYRTRWANALYLLLGAALLLLIYRQLVQRERMRTALEVGRAEARHLQDLDSLRSRFFANISHEFRTPLTLLLGPLQRLEADPEGGSTSLFAMMTRNARRLGQLIDQLLDLSRLEAGRLPLRWHHDDPAAFLRALSDPFATLADDRDISFTASIPAEPLTAWFDADVLEKVVGNLLSNALKFTPETGSASIVVRISEAAEPRPIPSPPAADPPAGEAAARLLTVAVANTGSYIPPAEQAHVFDRFRQLAGSTRAGGSGIGLALVKELVALQHGDITLSSDPDRGTCFTVILPLFLTPPPGASEEPAEEPLIPEGTAVAAARAEVGPLDDGEADAASAAAPSVLVVEDNSDLRAFVVQELVSRYRVREAPDGEQGLATALAEIPDLVVSDVMMPGMDGFELCGRLKDDLRTSHVPVILLTARAGIESRLEGLERGADDYLAKPFDPRELRVRIANLIATRRKLQEQYATQVLTLEPEAMPVTSADERFLRRCREVIDENLDNDEFTVEIFAKEVGLSRAQLHRKLKAITDLAPRDLLRTQRLKRAAHLLEGRYGNVTEVAYAVGFKSLSHFARSFREQFGVSPSDYLRGDSKTP